MGELGEARGERGGGSPALQVQHPEVLQIIMMIMVVILLLMMTVMKDDVDCKRSELNEENFIVSHLIVLQLAEDCVKLDPGFVKLVLQHIGPLEAGGGHSHNGSFLFELELLSSSLTFLSI